jgi:lipopolysaccharide transport system permease protein
LTHLSAPEAPQTPALPGWNATQATKALDDLARGLSHWELWGTLGWKDIRHRYRRSIIGPFWLTLSMGILIGGVGLLWCVILKQRTADYLPYFGLGIIVWSLISHIIVDSATIFISSAGMIKHQATPLSIYVFKNIWINLIIFLHNIIIYVAIAILFRLNPGYTILLAAVGLALICLNGVWIGIVLGITSLRFHDVPPIVSSVTQVVFFMTPIFWRPEQLPATAHWVIELNPAYYFIEVVRQPLLGQVPPISTWLIVVAFTILGYVIGFIFYVKFRRRIAYWV